MATRLLEEAAITPSEYGMLSEGRRAVKLDGHTNLVTSVRFSPDGNMIASGSEDRTIRI